MTTTVLEKKIRKQGKVHDVKNNLHKFDVGLTAVGLNGDYQLNDMHIKNIRIRELSRVILIIDEKVITTIDVKNMIYEHEKKGMKVDFFKGFGRDITTDWADINEETYTYSAIKSIFKIPVCLTRKSRIHVAVKMRNSDAKPNLICEYTTNMMKYSDWENRYKVIMHDNQSLVFLCESGKLKISKE